MLFITLSFLLAVGHCGAESWQKLTCPLKEEHRGLPMVWCRRTSSDCCSGLSFGHAHGPLDHGGLRVTLGPDSFSVEVLKPHREGMYWCGRTGGNGTIIKLDELYIYGSLGSLLWSVTRWTLLPLLPLLFLLINCIYSRTVLKPTGKRSQDSAGRRVEEQNEAAAPTLADVTGARR